MKMKDFSRECVSLRKIRLRKGSRLTAALLCALTLPAAGTSDLPELCAAQPYQQNTSAYYGSGVVIPPAPIQQNSSAGPPQSVPIVNVSANGAANAPRIPAAPAVSAGQQAVPSAVSALAPAGLQPAGSMDLLALEQQALANHPSIQAYEQKICALRGRWEQAGLGPNPQVGYKWEEFHQDRAGGSQVFEVSQEFLGGNQLYHAQGVVSREIETVSQELEMVRLKVRTDVRIAAYEYLAVLHKQKQFEEISRNDAELARQIQVSFENQNASKLDLVNARISARKSRQQYLNVQNDALAAWGRLACLIGAPEMEPCEISANLDQIPQQKTWESYVQILLSTSPEIIRAQAKVAEAHKKIEYENSKNSTNFRVGGEMAYNTSEDFMVGTLGVSMPLRVRDRNQGNISAARSEAIQAQKDLERLQLNVQHRLSDVYAQYANASQNLALYRNELLPEAEEALELAKISYENGESSMLDLFTVQRTYRETNIEYYDALCQYWTNLTILEGKLLSGALEDTSL